MQLVRFDSDDPRAHLACDEVLLDRAEAGLCGETLRLYELARPAVVLGVGLEWRREARADACEADGVPVLRRCSGGGGVVVGPGCLCYSLVLDARARPELSGVRSTHRWAVTRLAEALSGPGLELRFAGLSDLAWGDRKAGGSAQRRKRRHVLQHGTVLYDLDVSLMDRYLPHPADEPDYRAGRPHAEFAANLPLPRGEVAARVLTAFGLDDAAPAQLTPELADAVADLVCGKYARPTWNLRR